MTKQTGPEWAVKRLSQFGAIGRPWLLYCPDAAAPTDWTHPNEVTRPRNFTPTWMTCNKNSEEDTLQRDRPRTRVDYSGPARRPQPQAAEFRGQSPMQMHDQDTQPSQGFPSALTTAAWDPRDTRRVRRELTFIWKQSAITALAIRLLDSVGYQIALLSRHMSAASRMPLWIWG